MALFGDSKRFRIGAYPERTCRIERLVPPKGVDGHGHGTMRQSHDFQLCHGKMLEAPRRALSDKPECLQDGQRFGEAVAFASVLELWKRWGGQRAIVHQAQNIVGGNGFEWLVVFIEKIEPFGQHKESVRQSPTCAQVSDI